MKRVWLYERRYTDSKGVKFGIVYLDSKFERPPLYLDGPYEKYKTPAVTLLVGKMYRLTLSYDARQSDNFQIEWLVQELGQKKLGEVSIKNKWAGVGLHKMPPEFREAFDNAFKLASSTSQHPKPWNLGQPTRLTSLEFDKPKRGKLSTKKGKSASGKKPVAVNKASVAAAFQFKSAT
jgi:hypothetical protein